MVYRHKEMAWSVSECSRLVVCLLLVFCMVTHQSSANQSFQRVGCHRLGHSRDIMIQNCVKFRVTTNACRGFCTSYAIPSPSWVIDANPNHLVTSRAACCSITRTHDVHVNVRCLDGDRTLTFKSAAECACDVCRNG